MAKYVEMVRRTRVTENKVKQFHDPGVIVWHLARPTNGQPTFSIALFRDITKWIPAPAFSSTETYGWETLVKIIVKMHQVWNLPLTCFTLQGSMTYNTEMLRNSVEQFIEESIVTHETRSQDNGELRSEKQ